MDPFLKMDIFFVVATLSNLLIGILLAVLLFYAIRLLRTVNRIADVFEVETHAIQTDINTVRNVLKEEGAKTVGLVHTLLSSVEGIFRTKRRRKKPVFTKDSP